MSGSFARPKSDQCAGQLEATDFVVVLPEVVYRDRERCRTVLQTMRAAFPSASFKAVKCEWLIGPAGRDFEVDEPLVVPLMGTANGAPDRGPLRRRPSDQRMAEMQTAVRAAIGRRSGLH